MTPTIFGTPGDDFVHGTNGNDIIEGGRGNDFLVGRDGSNTYLFRRGDGQDYIDNHHDSAGQHSVLRFGEGISSTGVTVSREGMHLLLDLGSGDRITVFGYFHESDYGHGLVRASLIDEIRFADGVSWDLYAVRARVEQDWNWAGVTYGGGADEVFENFTGNHTYVLGRGMGSDTILSPFSQQWDARTTVALRGVPEGGVLLNRPEGSNDLVVALKGSADKVTIKDYFDWSKVAYAERLALVFEGGVQWDAAELRQQVEYGQYMHVAIEGSGGADYLSAYGGEYALLNGGDGDDTLMAGGDTVLLGGAGDDVLQGGWGSALMDGGSGNDRLIPHAAKGIVVFGHGSGNDELLLDNDSAVTVVFDQDVLPSQVTVKKMGPGFFDLLLEGSGARLLLLNFAPGQQSMLRFADGTVWDFDHLDNMPIKGSEGHDYLAGSWLGERLHALGGDDVLRADGGDDILNGGKGFDHLEGGSGVDTYVFQAGDGDDVLSEDWHWGVEKTIIEFGAGVTPADVVLANEYGTLRVSYGVESVIRVMNFNFETDRALVPLVFRFDGGVEMPYADFAPNRAPQQTWAQSQFDVVVGQAFNVSLAGLVFDPDGDALVGSLALNFWESLPDWLAFNPTTLELSGTPVAGSEGWMGLYLQVADPDGASVSAGVQLVVIGSPAPGG